MTSKKIKSKLKFDINSLRYVNIMLLIFTTYIRTILLYIISRQPITPWFSGLVNHCTCWFVQRGVLSKTWKEWGRFLTDWWGYAYLKMHICIYNIGTYICIYLLFYVVICDWFTYYTNYVFLLLLDRVWQTRK